MSSSKGENEILHRESLIQSRNKMNVDQALEESRPLGRSQMVVLLAAVLMNIQTAFTMLSNVFLAKNVPYHCVNQSGYSLEENVTDEDGDFSPCLAYSYPGSEDNETTACTRWEFDTSVAGKSIVSEVSHLTTYLMYSYVQYVIFSSSLPTHFIPLTSSPSP